MKLCGHELNKLWYSNLKTRVKSFKIQIEVLESDTIKFNLDEKKMKPTINRIKQHIEAEKANLELFTAAIDSLPDKEKTFCINHYIKGKTIEEIADIMFYSSRTVNRIKDKAVVELEAYIKDHDQRASQSL